jgi:hypothetical protein
MMERKIDRQEQQLLLLPPPLMLLPLPRLTRIMSRLLESSSGGSMKKQDATDKLLALQVWRVMC